ncbi:hypothetical protein [Petrachloros mirabilis]
MTSVMVDGKRYFPADEAGDIKIVVLDGGFVYVGRVDTSQPGFLSIRNARCLIRWGTTKHLGELVSGPLSDTTLGDPCIVRCYESQVKHMIEVNQDAWKTHID